MARTNFESLRVYQLSEQLADSIWEIVFEWNAFARDTVGKQLVKAADSVEQISQRERSWDLCRQSSICENRQRFTE